MAIEAGKAKFDDPIAYVLIQCTEAFGHIRERIVLLVGTTLGFVYRLFFSFSKSTEIMTSVSRASKNIYRSVGEQSDHGSLFACLSL